MVTSATVQWENASADKPVKELIKEHKVHGANMISEMFKSERYADFTICSRRRSFRVHKAIVCPQSQYFDNLCSGGFKEASTGQIDLEDDDPEIVEKMISYFYNHTYDDEPSSRLVQATAEAESPQLAATLRLPSIRNSSPPSYMPMRSRSTQDGPLEDASIVAARLSMGPRAVRSPKELDDSSKTSGLAEYTEASAVFRNLKTEIVPQLKALCHVAVYAIADKYQVHQLKDFAAARFEMIKADHQLSRDRRILIIQEVIRTTRDSDEGIRSVILDWLSNDISNVLADPSYREILEMEPGLAVKLLDRVVKLDKGAAQAQAK